MAEWLTRQISVPGERQYFEEAKKMNPEIRWPGLEP